MRALFQLGLLVTVLAVANCETESLTPNEETLYTKLSNELTVAPPLSVVEFNDGRLKVIEEVRGLNVYFVGGDSLRMAFTQEVLDVHWVWTNEDLYWAESMRLAAEQLQK